MSSERAGVHTSGPDELAERYRAATGWEMAEGHAVTDAFLAGYRAGTPTHGALDREKAEPIVVNWRDQRLLTVGDLLDALEACVVPDPRIARIEALLKQYEEHPPNSDWYDGNVPGQELRAILRGDE